MIRLLGALILVTFIGLAACSSGDNGNTANNGDNVPTSDNVGSSDDNPCSDTGGSPVTIEDGIPEVEGEVTTTASGLQIIDTEVGDGDAAQPGERVCVHYTGYLEDGTVFDSSVARGQPIEFSLTGVIQGWQEGIPGMQIDGKRRLIIPPELAYGENPPGSIPPNATLIFDVELLALVR